MVFVSEEKQKSDAEEDGGTASQEEDDRKPKAEVTEGGVRFPAQAARGKVPLSRRFFQRVILMGWGSKKKKNLRELIL